MRGKICARITASFICAHVSGALTFCEALQNCTRTWSHVKVKTVVSLMQTEGTDIAGFMSAQVTFHQEVGWGHNVKQCSLVSLTSLGTALLNILKFHLTDGYILARTCPLMKGALNFSACTWEHVARMQSHGHKNESARTRQRFIWKDCTLTAWTASSSNFSCSSWGDCWVVG